MNRPRYTFAQACDYALRDWKDARVMMALSKDIYNDQCHRDELRAKELYQSAMQWVDRARWIRARERHEAEMRIARVMTAA